MPHILQLLLLVHVMAAMLWFGASTSVPRRVREALGAERTVGRALAASLMRSLGPIAIAAIVAFLSGVALALLRPGGFASLPPRFHAGLTLSLAWLLLGAHGTRRTARRILDAILDEGPLGDATLLGKRLAIMAGIEHLLFVTVTLLMLWRL